MPEFLRWVRGKLKKENIHELPNGILYLKGGDLSEELKGIKHHIKIYNLSDYFNEEFFETKKVVYVR
jgi:16S rRNA (guanine527-N7)-methyltransferase